VEKTDENFTTDKNSAMILMLLLTSFEVIG
jgi:hypothetical protein